MPRTAPPAPHSQPLRRHQNAPYPPPRVVRGRVGYSPRINDPIFAKYRSRNLVWAVIFTVFMFFAAVIGFYIYGENSSDITTDEAISQGIILGLIFVAFGVGSIINRLRKRNWDGVVVNKTKKVHRDDDDDDNNATITVYIGRKTTMRYTIHFRDDRGKKRRYVFENDPVRFNYFQVGDRVRYHAKMETYEKYDKSRDTIIFCNLCRKQNDIAADTCYYCKGPLLK